MCDATDTGHGHVVPRVDGGKARCGGPAICSACALEAAGARLECEACKRRKAARRALVLRAGKLTEVTVKPAMESR